MSKSIVASLVLIVGFLWASATLAHSRHAVQVEILDAESGTELAQFRESSRVSHVSRAYLAAERGQRYSIRVRNLRGTRVGVVIAVDGRNIITGARSNLGPSERMYILEPWQTANYSGWRADLSSVNEFYFTDWKNSYAEAFGDASAQGVIAVAVFDELARGWMYSQPMDSESQSRDEAVGPSKAAPRAAAPPVARSAEQRSRAATESADSVAGTGYGERVAEVVREVEFEANPRERARVLLKYEWRDQLCAKRRLACEPANRLWDADRSLGFAPPPPRRRPAS